MTLRSKLVVGLGLIGALLAVLVVFFQLTLGRVRDEYEGLLEHAVRIENDAQAASIAMLLARKAEKNFLLEKKPEYGEQVHASLEELSGHAGSLRDLARETGNPEVERLAGDILAISKEYADTFDALQAAWTRRGLDHNSGLQGAFRDTVHGMMDAAKGVDELQVLILTLRRHEKDYLLRLDTKYADELDQTVEALRASLGVLPLAPELRARVLGGVKEYQTGFRKLVAQDDVIRDLSEKMRAVSHKIEPLTDQIMTEASRNMKATRSEIEGIIGARLYSSFGLAVAAAVLAVLVGGIILRMLGRQLGADPAELALIANRVAVGDLTYSLDRKEGQGSVYEAIKNMSAGLRAKAELARAIAGGDLTRDVRLASEQDELGRALGKMVLDLRGIIQRIEAASRQIDAGTGQVSGSSTDLSQGASEQAAAIEEITSSMTLLSANTRANAESADRASGLAAKARGAAQVGSGEMGKLTKAMGDIEESSRSIENIIKVIDEIAFQTNLLALNAAVEAARAGSHGKGFAVVAEEVRNLAGRSAKAARETSSLIQDSSEKVRVGTSLAGNTSQALGDIVGAIDEVADIMAEIAKASREQAGGMNEVSIGVQQIDTVTQHNTANAEETASAAQQLAALSFRLRDILRGFRLPEEGGELPPGESDGLAESDEQDTEFGGRELSRF